MFTSGVAELTRHRAEQMVREWVTAGDLRRGQAQSMVKDLVDWSRQNRRELISFVQSEIQSQIAALGLPSKREVDRLERRVARLEERVKSGGAGAGSTGTRPRKKATSRSGAAGTKATTRSTAAKSTASKKTATRRATGGSETTPKPATPPDPTTNAE